MITKDYSNFQSTVSEYLVRYRNILDVMAKLQESSAHVNRAIVNSVTTCGCVKIDASKPFIPESATLAELSSYISTQLEGDLCPSCIETIESELGNALFYLAGTCEIMGLDMRGIMSKELSKRETLGKYNLT